MKRTRIGILFINDDIGVIYYLYGIIKTLQCLADDKKPEIFIFYRPSTEKYLSNIKYPHLHTIPYPFYEHKVINYLKSILQRKNIFVADIAAEFNLDGLYPVNDFPPGTNGKRNYRLISWIPDFQHKFYPQLFKKTNLYFREQRFKNILCHTDGLILSSYNAKSHLDRFYKYRPTLPIQILQFISFIKDLKITAPETLSNKYPLDKPYFLVSNQFYEHKNHITVLRAIEIVKQKNTELRVFFTGKTEDYRNAAFFPSLQKFIIDHNLTEQASILGLIPREDQLALLKGSLAVIQPSKFEGWSTVVEDAKTLQHQVIASDLPVHLEQLNERGHFFGEDSHQGLAEQMIAFLNGTATMKNMPDDYDERIEKISSIFMSMFNN